MDVDVLLHEQSLGKIIKSNEEEKKRKRKEPFGERQGEMRDEEYGWSFGGVILTRHGERGTEAVHGGSEEASDAGLLPIAFEGQRGLGLHHEEG